MKAAERKTITPDFICKTELATHLGCDIHTINKWVIEGTIPPPHAKLGKRYVVWLRRHYREFLRTGQWPSESYPRLEP
jgi:predicted DNA-binding transcriptional regulator AlpA